MLIKTKLRLGSILLGLVPALVATTLIGWNAVNTAQEALRDQSAARLTSLREEKTRQIERYFEVLNNVVLSTAQGDSAVKAVGFMYGFHRMAKASDDEREKVRTFYEQKYAPEYAKFNGGETPNIDDMIRGMGERALGLQIPYVVENENPIGELGKLDNPWDGTGYSRLHEKYHPSFRETQHRMGFKDIFLVHAESGNVLYSVGKRADFGTSLKEGPFVGTGLAEAYQEAIKLQAGELYMSDFAPYQPYYNNYVAFIGSPVFEEGNLTGALIVQIDSQGIDTVMNGDRNWEDAGLGKTGEAYLVGEDFKMRSENRLWLENPEVFLTTLSEKGEAAIAEKIQAKGSVVGLETVESESAKEALEGNSGFTSIKGPQGNLVLSAFTSIDINGNKWAMIAEVSEEEAYSSAVLLRNKIVVMALLMLAILAAVSGVLGWLFSASIVAPLEHIVSSMKDISCGSGDLTARLDIKSKDEFGRLSSAFNVFVEKLDSIMSQVRVSTSQLSSTSEDLTNITHESRQGVERQEHEVHQVAQAIEEMSASVNLVADNTQATAEAATQVKNQVDSGKNVLNQSMSAVNQLHQRMEKTQAVVEGLQGDSTRVGSVLDVIRGISEQTNLLALNAAIESARAGEQGRGFAVVADEVRTLALKTQQSTEEIRVIIESLQERSNETVEMLSLNGHDIEASVDLSTQTQSAFQEIESALEHLMEMSGYIASASKEQATVTIEIRRNAEQIAHVAQANAEGAEKTEDLSQDLGTLGARLNNLVSQFRTSQCP